MTLTDGFVQPNFGCGPTDLVCMGQEGAARFLTSGMTAMSNFMADTLTNAFEWSRPTDSSWNIASGQSAFWISVMTVVLLCVAFFQLIPALILRDHRRIVSITLGLAGGIPASAIAVWLMQRATYFGGTVTDQLMNTIQDQGMASALLRLFGYRYVSGTAVPAVDGAIARSITAVTSEGAGSVVGQYLVTFLLVCLITLASLFLFVAMSIRSFGLVVLAATAPIGFMMIGQPKFGVWSHRWLNLTLGLVFAEPLAAAVLVLAVQLLDNDTDLGLLVVAAAAVFIAAFSPLWATKLVSFAGSEIGNALTARPSITTHVNKISVISRVASNAKRVIR
jgi:hypothetical protein